MGQILHQACIPYPGHPCTAEQNTSLQNYRDLFVEASAAVWKGKPRNGLYVDSCYVHEQNVNYCSGQGMPNCVGWSPLESGSKKWGYTTAVTAVDGRSLTPQQAFSAFYLAGEDRATVDALRFPDNPTCHFLGKPVA